MTAARGSQPLSSVPSSFWGWCGPHSLEKRGLPPTASPGRSTRRRSTEREQTRRTTKLVPIGPRTTKAIRNGQRPHGSSNGEGVSPSLLIEPAEHTRRVDGQGRHSH